MTFEYEPFPLVTFEHEPIPLVTFEYKPIPLMTVEYEPIPLQLDAPTGVAKWHWETFRRFRPADFPESQSDWWAAVDSLGPRHCPLVARRLSSLPLRSFL